ncbi:MAG: (2Fe-2S) ferredoxin domain-containing protein, partial [Deltaproteobacteria bacterium]|nr:(2Fe-2S) ferredoxin domain-containing protein [Deltaproteobacteria bacterium]
MILCGGTGCQASRSKDLIQAVKDELVTQGLEKSVLVRSTGCHGFCEQGPIVIIEPGNTFYCHVLPEDARDIIAKTIVRGELIERLLYTDPVSGET